MRGSAAACGSARSKPTAGEGGRVSVIRLTAVLSTLLMLPAFAVAQGGDEAGRRTLEFETTEVMDADVAVSPDDQWLIFTMLGHLFRVPVEGGTAEQLTVGPYYDTDPVFSPDGARVAFVSDRDASEANIFVVELSTGAITQVTREPRAGRPAWTPDGNAIVYLSFAYEQSLFPPASVRRIDLTSRVIDTISVTSQRVRSVFHLPDGRLAWAVLEGVGLRGNNRGLTTRIESVSRNGSVSTLATVAGVVDRAVAGPSADAIYVRRYLPLQGPSYICTAPDALLVIGLADRTERPVFPLANVRSGRPAFAVSRDGTHLYVGDGGRIWKLDVSTGTRHPVPEWPWTSCLCSTCPRALCVPTRQGPVLFCTLGFRPMGDWLVQDEEQARALVLRQQGAGASFIKIHPPILWRMQRALARHAREAGLPIIAHGTTVEQVVKGVMLGFTSLEHTINHHRAYDDVLQLLAAAGTYLTPTLGAGGFNDLLVRDEPERLDDSMFTAFTSEPCIEQARAGSFMRAVETRTLRGAWVDQLAGVRSAHRAGVRLLVGTDAFCDLPQSVGAEGSSLHWELEHFVSAGLTPLDVLRIATSGAAAALGSEQELGTIEPGKLADIVLLDENPRDDIRHTQAIWRVIKGGRVFDPEQLRPTTSAN